MAETAAETAVGLVPQAHGGALRRGGVPGQRGGSGRPSSGWKRALRGALRSAKGLEVLKRIVSGDILEQLGTKRAGEPIYGTTKNSDRIRAIEFLAEHGHGLPTQHVETDTQLTIRIVRE